MQHFFACRPSDNSVSGDAGINPGLLQLWHWQSDDLATRLDLIRKRLDLIHTRLDLTDGYSLFSRSWLSIEQQAVWPPAKLVQSTARTVHLELYRITGHEGEERAQFIIYVDYWWEYSVSFWFCAQQDRPVSGGRGGRGPNMI